MILVHDISRAELYRGDDDDDDDDDDHDDDHDDDDGGGESSTSQKCGVALESIFS